MNKAENGRIKLSIGELSAIATVLLALVGAYVDLRVTAARTRDEVVLVSAKLDALRNEVDLTKQYDTFEHGKLEDRVKTLEARHH